MKGQEKFICTSTVCWTEENTYVINRLVRHFCWFLHRPKSNKRPISIHKVTTTLAYVNITFSLILDNLGYHADGKLDFFFFLTSAIALHVWSVFQREWVQISASNDYIDFFVVFLIISRYMLKQCLILSTFLTALRQFILKSHPPIRRHTGVLRANWEPR